MMAGAALTPLADFAQENKLTNWAGNLTYSTTNLTRVTSIPEADEAVRRYDRLKVLGTRHCFNKIADSHDRFLSLSALNQVIALDTQNHTVTVQAGIRYGELAIWLNNKGYALHNLASLPHISVAGGCITATHGSGVHNANLSSAVKSFELITASGDIVEFSREKKGELFNGSVVNLGGLGVVTKVTLAILPTYQISQYVFENLPIAALQQHFDEIMAAGYSVSLFTDWRNGNIGEVWIKTKVGEGRSFAGQPEFFGATAAKKDLHPISSLSAENCTPQMGVPGPWHERLPHFRLGFTPSAGKELQSEYFVPREHSFAAIKAVEQLHDQISPHLQITEVRCIDADDLWMSPCYHRPGTTIHFTWQPDWPAVSKLLPLIEAQLAPFHAKPHWGKLFTLSHRRLTALYARMPEFQRLLRDHDPKGKFRNDFLNTVIFGS